MFQLSGDDFFCNSDSAVCAEVRSPQPNYPEHSHDFHELIIVTKGSGQHVLNDKPANLAKNHICFISPNDRHLFEQVDDLHLTNILFKKSRLAYSHLLKNLLPSEDTDDKSWLISTSTLKRIEQIMTQLEQEAMNNSVDSRIMAEALFQQLIVELSRGRLTSSNNNTDDNTILQVIDWLQNNFSEDICVDDISHRFDISARTLSRKIKQVTNLTFNNYVHRVRVNKAIDLLHYTDLSITDIAFQVGYKDSNYFSTKFKRFTNQTPSQFR